MVTKKNAARVKAQMKAIQNQNSKLIKPDFEPMEDIFDKIKQGFILTLETNVITAKRVDNLASVRDSAYNFWGKRYLEENLLPEERFKYFIELQNVSVEAYEKLLDIAETFTLEEFSKEDMKDYFEDVVPPVEEISDEKELFKALIIFKCVQPYGSKMLQAHQMIREEIEKRKAYDES